MNSQSFYDEIPILLGRFEMKKESDLIESLMEDVLLAEEYGEDVIKVEKGESESYEFETVENLFKLIK